MRISSKPLVALAFCCVIAHPEPLDPHAAHPAVPPKFVSAIQCTACHDGMMSSSGEDLSMGRAWRATMMANSARDPYWRASVRREVMDHPHARAHIEHECATCHMPIAHQTATAKGELVKVLEDSYGRGANGESLTSSIDPGRASRTSTIESTDPQEGVSCTVCHQISSNKLGTTESFNGRFELAHPDVNGARPLFGPYVVDAGRQRLMHSAIDFSPQQSAHVQRSELCATCHTLYTQALDARGQVAGRLPEQVPYLEWLQSRYRDSHSCQSCHMPQVEEKAAISAVLGELRPDVSRHTFEGANAFMLGMLQRHRDELGVTAPDADLEAGRRRTIEFLSSRAARITIERPSIVRGTLEFDAVVRNLAGHKLPTAYPSRRAWIHVRVHDATGALIFESGKPLADGSIAGNDNDAFAERFEPHYTRIGRTDDVQIYESIMHDSAGRVTTGLLQAVGYVKDNRLLPEGLARTDARGDIAVRGDAVNDEDFGAGVDRVRYSISLGRAGGRYVVEMELLYQSIGFRWAHNLEPYDASEPQRFLSYFREAAPTSAMRLAGVEISVEAAAGCRSLSGQLRCESATLLFRER